MEKVDKDPEKAPGRSVLPENQEPKTRVSAQKSEADPNKDSEKSKREEQERPKRILNLQRELMTSVTNIQTAADAKELERRTELEEARRIRREQQENNAKSCLEKIDEIMTSWSALSEMGIPQELREALNSHQQLCASVVADKKKLLNDMQQELKKRDDHYVKTLRKNEEQIDLLIERMEDQIKTLTNAYREELGQTQMVDQQETEVSLAKYKAEWQQEMQELWEKKITGLMERRQEVEKHQVKLYDQMLKDTDIHSIILQEENTSKFKMQREHQQMKATDRITKLQTQDKQQQHSKLKTIQSSIKSKNLSYQEELKALRHERMRQQKESEQRIQNLYEEYKRTNQQYERLQKQVKHFAAADARTFREMRLMAEEERKQQVEKVLALDSQICRHLGVAWKRPPMPFMESSGPIQPQKQAPMPGHQEQEGEFSEETIEKAVELLCDEAGFLVESKLLNLLAPLENEEQTVVKLGALFQSLGIDGEDVPKWADFLLKYKQEQRVHTEDVCAESSDGAKAAEASTNTSSELIYHSHVLPALRSFLKQRMESRESSAHKHSSVGHAEAQDASDYKGCWDSMANVISDDKLKMWDAAERMLRQYHAILTDISELHSQNERMEKHKAELWEQVQQISNSRVSGCHKK